MQTKCGKIEYATRGEARGAIVKLRKYSKHRAHKKKGRDMNAYKCRNCGHWHIGHPRTIK